MISRFELYISPNATPGTQYELRVRLVGRVNRGNGNPVDINQESAPIIVLIGKHGYKLRLILKEPDGSKAFGLVRIYYMYQGGYRLIYREAVMGEYTFRVIDGKYLIEVYLSGYKLASKEVEVDSDVTIEIQFTTTLIPEDSVLFVMKPTYTTDPLIFRQKW